MRMDLPSQTDEKKDVDILSFDGGGSRGIMEVSILNDVMRLATVLLRDPEMLSYLLGPEDVSTSIPIRKRLIGELANVSKPLHPNEVYDMIVGTSTGALIAFALVGGNSDENGKRLPMTLEDCIKMYKQKTKKIFTKSWSHWFLSGVPGLRGVPITTYSKDNVKDALFEQFNDSCLASFRDCRTIAGAVARQIGRNEELVLFDTRTDAYKLYKTVQVLQATTDAPVYFDTPVKIGDKQFVDGGVGGNCPLVQAIGRARKLFGNKVEIKSALSIAPPSPKESEIPAGFQVKYWLNYFAELSTNGYAVYLDAKRRNKNIKFQRLSPRGESLKNFKLDEIDAEKMLKALDNEKLSKDNDLFLVDIIATAAFVVDTYLRKTMERPEKTTVKQAAKLAHIAGKIYSRKFEYELAIDSYKTSLSLWEKLADEDNKTIVAEIYQDIADCLSSQGRYPRACNLLQKVVQHWKNFSDEAKSVKASFKLAECLLLDARHKEAQAKFMEVLEKQRELYGTDAVNAEVACTLNRLGWCLREQGVFNQAIQFYFEALKMRKQLCPSGDDVDIAETLNSLGLTCVELGKNADAVTYAKESLDMRQRLNKEDLIAESLNNLGRCQVSNSEYGKAQKNLNEALKMKKKVYGDVDHPSIAITLENLAECMLFTNADDPDSALEYAQQALKMKKTCMGDVNNSAIAKTLRIIAHCYEKAGNYEEATKFYKASMQMIKLVFCPTHPSLVHILSCLGHSLLMEKKYAEAKSYLNEARNIEIQRDKDSLLIASLSEEIAQCD